MTDQHGNGATPQDAQDVDLVDLHEVEVLDEVRLAAGQPREDAPDDVIDLDDEHVEEDDADEADHLDHDGDHLDHDGDHLDHDGDHLDHDGDQADEDQSDQSDQSDADVMVLDSWQIQLAATGDEQVDAALARLTEVEGLPPSRHPEIYEAVHGGLTGALANLDRS